MIFFKSILAAIVVAGLSACGGGDDANVDTTPTPVAASYITFKDMVLSAPSAYAMGYAGDVPFSQSAGFYCSGSRSTNGGPIEPANFNKEIGWSVPTRELLEEFQQSGLVPTTWGDVNVWTSGVSGTERNPLATTINIRTGRLTFTNADSNHFVICTKKVS